MLSREPQHVTAIGNVTDYDAHNKTMFLSLILIWVHPPSGVLQRCWPRAPAEFRSVVVLNSAVRDSRFREDAIGNIDTKKCGRHVNFAGWRKRNTNITRREVQRSVQRTNTEREVAYIHSNPSLARWNEV